MSKETENVKSKSLADFDRMVHRFSSPLSDLYRSYLAIGKFREARDNYQRKKDSLIELRTEENEILAEYERYKGVLYNESCNVQHLYEQNENKLTRTLTKLHLETAKLEKVTSDYENVVEGMRSLDNIAEIMNGFLHQTMVYKNFVDNAAKETKQFDSFSHIINKYNSLMSIFRKNTDVFNSIIENTQLIRAEIVEKARIEEEEVNKILCRLSRAAKELEKEAKKTSEIELKLHDLHKAGVNNEMNAIRINLYRASLLEALISSKAVDESILKDQFHMQIDIISEKFKMLSSIAKSLN